MLSLKEDEEFVLLVEHPQMDDGEDFVSDCPGAEKGGWSEWTPWASVDATAMVPLNTVFA